MEAVGTGGHDSVEFVLIQRFDILGCHRFKEIFLTHSSSRISCARFLISQNGIVHSCRFKYFNHRFGNVLIAGIISSSATHPVKDISFFFICHKRKFNSRFLRPFRSIAAGKSPGITKLQRILQTLACLGGRFSFRQDEKPTHIGKRRNVVDEDRTLFHTGTTG